MAKKMTYAAIALALLLGGGFLVITLTLDSIVQSNIEKIGSEMTGTRVTADEVSISLFSGQGTITGFRVANPDGFSTEHALVVDDFFIKMDILSLLSDEITINDVWVTGPAVYVEQKLTENNLQTILNTIKKAADRERDKDPDDDPSPETGFVIGHFLVEDGSVNFYTTIGGEQSAWVNMSKIELYDLGRDNGKQAAGQVVVQIAEAVVEKSLRAAARSGTEQLKDAIQGIFR